MLLSGLLCFTFFYTNVQSARIFAIYPIPSYSHHIIYRMVTMELHSKGHELVVLTTNPLRDEAPKYNYTEIDLSYLYKDIDHKVFSNGHNRNRVEIMYSFLFIVERFVHRILSNHDVQKIINGNLKFDLVLLEWSAHPSFCAFSELFQCPLVGIRPMVLKLEGNDALANPFTPSYMPLNYMHYENDFWGRMTNTFLTITIRLFYSFVMLPRADNIVRKYFKNHSTYIGDIEKNVSIVLANTYPVLTGPRPLVPAIVEIGGVHLQRKPTGNLQKDIRDFLDQAKEGVILFSFGTVVQSWDLPEERLQIFKDAFAEVPYKVLWRWGPDVFVNKSGNVKLYKWIQQQEALAHPNMKLFITHGGLHSAEESLVNGVPSICIPFFADQHCNCRQIFLLGAGKRFELHKLTKEILVDAIKELIKNNSYSRRAADIGKILLDQPVPPLEKAMWWIEYVLRHKGARHLRTEAVGMPWYIYYSVDVFAFTIIACCFVTLVLILISKILMGMLLYLLCPRKKEKMKVTYKID